MKLKKWLDLQKITNRDFAKIIKSSESAVHRWASTDDDKRIPRPEHMLAIEKATRGKVKAQDFYS
jgi:DNA-binding transcriptional regulator YdaS (Cro superfamily)